MCNVNIISVIIVQSIHCYIVLTLGDVFDEGHWCSSEEFEYYVQRFHSLFYVPKDARMYVVAGNHDMGFHYGIIKNIFLRTYIRITILCFVLFMYI